MRRAYHEGSPVVVIGAAVMLSEHIEVGMTALEEATRPQQQPAPDLLTQPGGMVQ
jgi:hypothetical protein